MSAYRQQALIEVPVDVVWNLVGDIRRHPEWWPKVVGVECEGLEEGCSYRQVTRKPSGSTVETEVCVERLDDCRELKVRCLDTGTYTRWLLTEAQGGTFIDAEFGIDPTAFRYRVFDMVAGKRYFRRWMQQSLDGLREAASRGEVSKTSRDDGVQADAPTRTR